MFTLSLSIAKLVLTISALDALVEAIKNLILVLRTITQYLTLLLLVILAVPDLSNAQELDCEVLVKIDQINNANIAYLDQLAPILEEYLNDFAWTEDTFQENERIECTLQFDFLTVDDNFNYSGSLIVTARRPIYGTMRSTQILQWVDRNWTINYPPNKVLVHEELQFDNLATLLDYYAYIILGFDYDTFSRLGGTPYFEKALEIVDLAQNANSKGWSRNAGSSGRQNRFFKANFMLDPLYENMRVAMYRYHRHGLDRFVDATEEARLEILIQMGQIQEVQRTVTDVYVFNHFFDNKYQELASIFKDAEQDVRLEAYSLLTQIDKSHINTYNESLQ